jgi:sugar transferase (PEP-CTERM system associated)
MLTVFAHQFKTLTVVEFLADLLICFLAVLVSARQLFALQVVNIDASSAATQWFVLAAEFTLVMALMYTFVGLYRRGSIVVGLAALLRRAFLAVFMGACIAYVALAAEGQSTYAIQLLGRSVAYMAIGVVLVRSLAFVARQSSLGARRILIVGGGSEAHEVARDIRADRRTQATIVGFYPTSADGEGDAPVSGFFSRDQSIERVVQDHRVDEIVVAVREQRGGGVPMDQLLACRIRGVKVLDLAGFYERAHSEVPTDSLKASWLVYGHGFVQGGLRTVVKRGFDLLFSTLLLLVAMPVMLFAMLAIRLESPGPILYRQERVGLGGRGFMCIKFRSMRTDAEKDGVARWATKNDSRVTRVGAFIRKTRIDELPQLFSVLRGDMSLVGPRPERPSFVSELKETIPFYDIRHSVKPGVTGWAQVRYGYCATLDDSRRKHQFDLYYVKNNSLLLDVLVLIETVSVVLFREGSQ